MALLNCPKCGRLVTDRAVTCPSCGHSFKSPEQATTLSPPEQPETISCPECGATLSHAAPKCPYCGYNLAPKKPQPPSILSAQQADPEQRDEYWWERPEPPPQSLAGTAPKISRTRHISGIAINVLIGGAGWLLAPAGRGWPGFIFFALWLITAFVVGDSRSLAIAAVNISSAVVFGATFKDYLYKPYP